MRFITSEPSYVKLFYTISVVQNEDYSLCMTLCDNLKVLHELSAIILATYDIIVIMYD